MNTFLRTFFLLTIAALLSGCPQTKEEKGLTETLQQYETIVRWAQWDAAVDFLAPEYLKEHPVKRLDLDRLRLFRVTQYAVRSAAPLNDGKELVQSVEIRMFNKNQAKERTIIDQQHWKFNDQTGRWQLHSGLPDPTQRNY